MSEEQQKQIDEIIDDAQRKADDFDDAYLLIAKAAYNLAVRKCAETAEADLIEETAWHEAFAEVNDKSILKNLIP